jgi:hypothetical protein
MRIIRAGAATALCSSLLVSVAPVAASDDAALDLKPESEAPAKAAQRPSFRAFGEVAVGRLAQRYGLGTEDTRRASLDLAWDFKLGSQWRAVLSDRLDDIHPVEVGGRSTLNSLREAFVGWQGEDGRAAMDLGRVNYRNGPAYGFNPTDYFRDGASRAVTTADPLALRENRLGTAMLRGQWLWQGGSATVALAPKLRDGPSRESFSADLGATNHADRALLAVSVQPSDRVGLQAFAFHEQDKGLQLGANGTMLFGEAAVGFVEWSGGRDTELLSAALGPAPRVARRHRAAAGLTYTTASKLSLTAELQYNGFALDKAQWREAVATYGIEAMGAYLYEVQRRQDIASRRAAMVYASQKDAGVKNLDLTGLVRYNVEDRSRFMWVEARYHFARADLALQWQTNLGGSLTEYGAQTGRSLVQVLAAVYF